MSWFWIAPAVVVVLGLIPVLVAAAGASAEARRLGDDLGRWHRLQPLVVEVRTDGEALRRRLAELRRR